MLLRYTGINPGDDSYEGVEFVCVCQVQIFPVICKVKSENLWIIFSK